MSGTLSLTFDNSAGSLQVRLPIIGTGVTANIDWGDTTSDTGVDPNTTTHTYPASGYPNPTAVVTITSSATSVTTFGDISWPGVANLTAVATTNTATWGLGTAVTNFSYLFNGAALLTSVPTDIPPSVTNMGGMFIAAIAFNQNIGTWNVSGVTNMSGMFQGASIFDQNIRYWSVQNTDSLTDMFLGATAMISTYTGTTGFGTTPTYLFFNQTLSLTFSDTPGSVTLPITGTGVAVSINWGDGTTDTSLSHTYSGAGPFTAVITITAGSVTTFGAINWSGVGKLTAVSTGDTTTWGLGTSVTSFASLFQAAFLLTSVPTNIPSSVTNMSFMFSSASIFNQNIGVWNVSNVTDMNNMFNGASAFDQNIGVWNVSNVTDMTDMFASASAFDQNIGAWNVSNVTNMNFMFYNASAFDQNIRYWSVQNTDTLTDMFNGATAMISTYTGTTGFGTTPTYLFFNQTLSLTFSDTPGSVTLPITGTGVVVSINWGDGTTDTSLSHTYSGPGPFTALISITAGTVTKFGSSAWAGVTKLTAVSTGDTTTWCLGTSVTDFSYLFYDAVLLTSVPSNIPSSVTNLEAMFLGATLFNENISNWDVSNVTNMGEMFAAATTFDQNIRYWSVQNTDTLTDMFNGATAMSITYTGTTGFGNTPTYLFFNQTLSLTFTNTAGLAVTLPISGTSVVVSIDWGDGNTDTSLSHTYSGAGPYTAVVTITSGTVTTFGSFNWPGVANLTAVSTGDTTTWGLGTSVTSFAELFRNASLLTSVPSDIPSSVTDMNNMFNGASIFNQNIGVWSVSNVTDMNNMFNGASAFDQNIGVWNVSNVTDMNNMFNGASAFDQNIGVWSVSNVTDMNNMFNGASAFDQNISTWNVSNVTDMNGMFYGASAFDQNISTWNVSNVTNMNGMFRDATTFDQNISTWNVSNVTDMGGMFQGASTFNQNIRYWSVQDVDILTDMFLDATAMISTYTGTTGFGTTPTYLFFNQTLSLTFSSTPGSVTLPISGSGVAVSINWGDGTTDTSLSHTYSGAGPFTAVITITAGTVTAFGSDSWDGVAKLTDVSTGDTTTWGLGTAVTSFAYLFKGAVLLFSVPSNIPSSVTNLSFMFQNATIFNDLNITTWDVSNVTNLFFTFYYALEFNQDISSWNVGNVTTMRGLFNNARVFNQAIGGWDVSSVTDMNTMFLGAAQFDQDISGWIVGDVTDMGGMFSGAAEFNQAIGGWDVSSVTDMYALFSGAAKFDQYIGGWIVSAVTDMGNMFNGATLFNQNISGWNVGNVTNMNGMFMLADSFIQNIGIWDVGSVTDMGYMFYGLADFNIDISGWDVSSVTNMEFMFYNTPSFNRDISGWDVSSVTNMTQMFVSSTSFNKNIRIWSVDASTNLTNMFNSATAFQAAFYPTTPGYNTTPNTPLYTFFNFVETLSLTFSNTPGFVALPIDVSGIGVSVNWGDSTINTSLSHTYSGAGPFTAVITITSGTLTSFGYVGWPGVDKLTEVATNTTSTWGLGSAVTSFADLFNGAVLLTSVPSDIPPNVRILSRLFIDASSFNQDISTWNVSNVTSMLLMFSRATSFNQDISDWDVGNVSNMSNMFADATAFNNGSLTNDEAHPLDWNTGSVTIMSGIFSGASAFNQDIGGWDVTNVTLMEGMFQGATLFNQNIGLWDVSNVVNMKLMFHSATNFNGDISGWDVSNVVNMNSMFMFANSFTQNIGIWDVGRVTDMGYMFYDLANFNIDISGWDVSSVTDMQRMFYNTLLFNRDISGWDVSSVTNMTNMFLGSIIFNQNIRIWIVGAGTDLTNMFDSATAFQARFYPTTPGYNTDPNTPLYTFFSYVPPPPPPPPPSVPVLRLPVGGGGGSFWYGREGFLFKGKGGGGARRSTKMGPGGNTTCNGSTYIYNKYKPGGGGVGASSIANRRAKNRLATNCGSQNNNCFPCFTTLGQYSNYTHNPNGYVVCSSNPPPTAPGAPTLNSVTRGNGQLTLNFTIGSDGGSPITDIEYSTDDGATWNSSGRTSSPIVVTGLTNGVTYQVAVRAKNVFGPKNTIGISPSSNVISGTPATTPSAPTLISLTPGNGQLTLNFTLGSTGGSAITNIEYSTNNGSTWISSGVTSSPIVVTGLTNGNTYQVAVRAINAVGTSPSSNVISGIPVTTPSAPTLVSLTPANGQLTLIFTLGSNGGSAITDIEYSINNRSTWNSSGVTSSPIVVTGLTNGVSYPVAVRAINAIGNGASSNVISGIPTAAAPSAPTLNSLTPGNARLTLNFTLGSNGGSAITDIEYSTNNGGTWTSSGATSSPILVTGLTNGVTYQVAVRAKNIVGTSPSSNVISGTPISPGPDPPTALSSVGGNQAAYILFSQVGIVTNYEYSTDDGVTFLPFVPAQTFSPVEINTLSSDGATRLTNGTTYNVKLKAVNSGGSSVESVSVSVTPTITSLLPTDRLINLDANNSSSYPGSGTAWTNLDSGGLYSATLQNSPTFDNINKWFTFDGINQIAQIAAAAAINPTTPFGSFTIQIWARVNTASPNFAPGDGLISKQFWAPSYDGYSLSLPSSSSVNLGMNGSSVNGNYSSAAGVYSNAWALYTIVVRFGGGSGNPSYSYVSTRRVVTANNGETGMPSPTAPLQFPRGIQNSTFNFCPADVGAFYLYNTALSQANIIQNYDATKTRYIAP